MLYRLSLFSAYQMQSVFGGVVLMCLLLAALGKELADVVPCLPLGLRPILDLLRNLQAVA